MADFGTPPQQYQQYQPDNSPGAAEAWDFINSGGARSLKFTTPDQWGNPIDLPIGTVKTGIVTTLPERYQLRDFDSREPVFWPDGNPKLGVKITLQTDERDAGDTEDDGIRVAYFQSGLLRALQTAMQTQKLKQFEVGSRLTITFTGYTAPKRAGNKPSKNYAVVIEPATSSPAVNAMLTGAPQAAPQQQYVPVPQAGPTAVAQAQFAPQGGLPPQQAVVPQVQYQQPAQPIAQAPIQAAPGAQAVQAILGGVEVQQGAPALPLITPDEVAQVQQLVNAGIPLTNATAAVGKGDAAKVAALTNAVTV